MWPHCTPSPTNGSSVYTTTRLQSYSMPMLTIHPDARWKVSCLPSARGRSLGNSRQKLPQMSQPYAGELSSGSWALDLMQGDFTTSWFPCGVHIYTHPSASGSEFMRYRQHCLGRQSICSMRSTLGGIIEFSTIHLESIEALAKGALGWLRVFIYCYCFNICFSNNEKWHVYFLSSAPKITSTLNLRVSTRSSGRTSTIYF